MSKKKTGGQRGWGKQKYPFQDVEVFLKMFGEAFILPVFKISWSLISGKPVKEYRYRRMVIIDSIGLVVLIVLLFILGNVTLFKFRFLIFRYIAIGIVGLLLLSLTVAMLRKRNRRKYTANDMSVTLRKALKIMDTTSKWYDDETEANIELVTTLKALNIDAEYGYKLPNGRIADARVGGGLVEGKLSPNTADVDRLLGQFPEYVPYGDKLHIVIYGELSNDARKRIENAISTRYLNNVFLVALSNPKRQRIESD